MAQIISKNSSPLTTPPIFYIGDSNYSDHILSPDYCYVDKTGFITKWWNKGAKISLIVRPRRFSKTMLLSTVNTWFNCKNLKMLFSETEVLNAASEDMLESRKYLDSILLTFKDINAESYSTLFRGLKKCLKTALFPYNDFQEECEKHVGYPFPETFTDENSIRDLMDYFTESLNYLNLQYEKKFVILIDEYDKLLMDAASVGSAYFESVLKLYREFLNALLKDKIFVEKSILTGVLPLAANSILSAFNNAVRDSFFDNTYSEIFGFTIEEVSKLTQWMSKKEQLRLSDYLLGYGSGETTVYNPWSVINYISDIVNGNKVITNTWIQSGNSEWINYGKRLTEEEFNTVSSLIEGEEGNIRINKDLNYLDRDNSLSNFLTYALYTGYLTFGNHEGDYASVYVPNKEVRDAWVSNLNKLVGQIEIEFDWGKVLDDLEESSESELYLTSILEELLENCLSSWDLPPENSYHMWMLGIMTTLVGSHKVSSNKESGHGRFDIAVTPLGSRKKLRNYVFELKRSDSEKALDQNVLDAVNQVKDKKYHLYFDYEYDLVVIGLAAHKKKIKVKIEVIPAASLYGSKKTVKRIKKIE